MSAADERRVVSFSGQAGQALSATRCYGARKLEMIYVTQYFERYTDALMFTHDSESKTVKLAFNLMLF